MFSKTSIIDHASDFETDTNPARAVFLICHTVLASI